MNLCTQHKCCRKYGSSSKTEVFTHITPEKRSFINDYVADNLNYEPVITGRTYKQVVGSNEYSQIVIDDTSVNDWSANIYLSESAELNNGLSEFREAAGSNEYPTGDVGRSSVDAVMHGTCLNGSGAKMRCINIVAINVCGLLSKLKIPEFLDFVKQYEIVCISESKLDQ